MSVQIKSIDKDIQYEVNGKIVYLDSNGNWISRQELTTNELKAFNNYKNAIIENKHLVNHPEATYKF